MEEENFANLNLNFNQLDLNAPNGGLLNGQPWQGFQALLATHEGAMERLGNTGNPDSGATQLKQIVKDRLQLTRGAYQMNQIMGGGFAAEGTASLSKPPIKNGMMSCVKKLRKIVIKDYDNGIQPNFTLVSQFR